MRRRRAASKSMTATEGSRRSGSPGARLTLFQVPRDRLPDGLVGHSKVSPNRGVAKPKLVENKDSRHDTPVGRC